MTLVSRQYPLLVAFSLFVMFAELTTAQAISSRRVTASTTTSSAAATHTISVGKADHKFEPNSLTANIGDTLRFEFYPRNHSVVRAEFGRPCVPIELLNTSAEHFYSGFQPIDRIQANPPFFEVPVNDTAPIYFYCSALGSCINYQMVGVVNPPNSTALQQQKDFARAASFALSPGEPWPAEGGTPPPGATTSPSPSIVSSSSSPSSTTGVTTHTHPHHLNTPTTIGIALGSAAAALILASLFFFFCRSRRMERKYRAQQARIDAAASSTSNPNSSSSPKANVNLNSPHDPNLSHPYNSPQMQMHEFHHQHPNLHPNLHSHQHQYPAGTKSLSGGEGGQRAREVYRGGAPPVYPGGPIGAGEELASPGGFGGHGQMGYGGNGDSHGHGHGQGQMGHGSPQMGSVNGGSQLGGQAGTGRGMTSPPLEVSGSEPLELEAGADRDRK